MFFYTFTAENMKDKILSFIWQHVLLLISLFVMTLGVALCVRSALGSSVISTIPFVMSLAGDAGKAPALTIGDYTSLMNIILVIGQIIVLRRQFHLVQLFQLVIGFLFGWLIDVNMALTSHFSFNGLWRQIVAQISGCVVLALGIAMEVRCGSVTMPGEGMPVAIMRRWGIPFPKAKIGIDISLVVVAVVLGFIYFGRWMWNVIGPGTLFAIISVGMIVKLLNPHMGLFDRILAYRPGFRRYIYGLLRFLR